MNELNTQTKGWIDLITIKEIAKAAGVSVSTASIVLRGESEKRKVAPATAQKVLKTAQQLDYTPNVSARRLRAPQSDGLMISIFWASFWAGEFRVPTLQFLRGVQSVLDTCQQKCELMIHPYQRGHLADNISRLSLCHAAIVCNATPADVEALEKARLPVPVVLHSRQSDVLPCVNIDYNTAGKIPANVFKSYGMQNAVLCASAAPFSGASDCEASFFHQVLQAGLTVRRIEVEHTMRGGYEAANLIAQMNPRPDCVFFMSDVLALGALRGFHENQIKIPQDLKLISLGSYDADMEEYVMPSLSVVRMPMEELGAAAFTKAIHLITGDREERVTRLPLSYVSRESCGPEMTKEIS